MNLNRVGNNMTESKTKTLDELASSRCTNYTPLQEVCTNCESFIAGWNECHAEDMKTIAALEEKLRIACEALERIQNHPGNRSYNIDGKQLTLSDVFFCISMEALSKIKGVE